MGKIVIIEKNAYFHKCTGYMNIWWLLEYSWVILTPFAVLVDCWITPLWCTGVTEGSKNHPYGPILPYCRHILIHRLDMWPTASIWWPLKYSLVILPPFAMLIDHWVTPLRCTGVTEGSNNQPRVALLAYFDQYTAYVTSSQYLMTPRVLLSNLTTICNAYWLLDSTLVMYRSHRRV